MKTKKLTPRNAAPVQRENTATVSRDGNAIAPRGFRPDGGFLWRLFVGSPQVNSGLSDTWHGV